MNIKTTLLGIISVLILAACSGSGSRYSISDDVGPDKPIQLDHIEDAHPVYEPFSRGGNRDYTLRGNSYKIIKEPQGFTQQGKASWYGKKFHGHLTSNGEIYDMYSMSAAHKTLPIPSYVRVKNLDNGKATIVRINDRGPFHDGRIIDLSYAAAYKLGVIKTGTANVAIEYITTQAPSQNATALGGTATFSIQTASSNHEGRSLDLADKLTKTLSAPTYIETLDGNYRILVGPYKDPDEAENVLQKVKAQGYPQAFIRKTKR